MGTGSVASRNTFTMPIRFFFPDFEMASSFKSCVAASLRLLVFDRTVQINVGLDGAQRFTGGIVGQCFQIERFRAWVAQTKSKLTADVLFGQVVPSLNTTTCGVRVLFFGSKVAIYLIIKMQRTGGVVARRIVDVEDERAFHHYLISHEIPEDERRELRIASKLLNASLELYRQLGIRRIYLDAGLSAGGRLWPKYGFCPTDSSQWLKCRSRIMVNLWKTGPQIQEEFGQYVSDLTQDPDPENIWFISKLTKKVPDLRERNKERRLGDVLLTGTSWRGTLNLDNPRATRMLEERLQEDLK